MSVDTTEARPGQDEASAYYFTYIDQVAGGEIVGALRAQAGEVAALLAGVSEEAAAARPAPGEWSIKEVVAHVADAERLFAFRALWFARGERAPLPGMEPGPWVESSDSNARPLADLLDELAHVRAATVALFANLDSAAWARRGTASGTVVSVRALAWIIAGHERHHIRSLREVYLVGQV